MFLSQRYLICFRRNRKKTPCGTVQLPSYRARFLPRCMECSRGIAMGILSVRPSVRPSVCLSVRQTRGLWQNRRKICLDFYTIRKIIYPSFLRRMVGGATPSTLNFGSTGPRWSEIADFKPIITRSASAVIPSEKGSINTKKKSPTRFPMSLRWPSYVASKSPKGGLKTAVFPLIALRLKKVCYKVYSCENCQRRSCRAFIGLTIHAKFIGGDVPFCPKFWVNVTALERNRRFSIYFRS